MSFTILGTKGQLRLRNPFKPNPLVAEEILLQHDMGDPPVVIQVKGVGLDEAPTKHLYQGEVDEMSRLVMRRRDSFSTDAPALSRDFSVGNAATLEALHRSADSGRVETVNVPRRSSA